MPDTPSGRPFHAFPMSIFITEEIHSELFALNNDRTSWTQKTAVILDEAAMVDTKLMAMVTAHAHSAGAKLILVGDDR